MVVMKEEEKEKEKENDMKQTSSFPLDCPRDSSTPNQTSHNEKNVTSLPECMHVCIPPLQPPSPIQHHNPLQPHLFSTRPISIIR